MYYRCLLMFLIAGALACVQDEKQCSNSRQCIPAEWWCDGRGDCDDGSDELNCDPCSRNPCLNHGTCYPTKFGFRCKCAGPFAGTLCDKTICDPCSSDPCLNNGTCYGTISGFRCNCLDEFGGTMCEKTLCAITECHTKADFVFVMDSSASIQKNGGDEAYQHMKDFFKATVDALVKKGPIGGDGFRIGFVLFSLDVSIEFDLNEFDDAKKLKEKIDALPFLNKETSMKEALKVTREELLIPSRGERPGDDTPNIVILLTDGVSSDGSATEEADKLKGDGAIIITVGVGAKIDEEQLTASSSRGEILQVDDFAALNQLVQGIIITICEEVGTVAPPMVGTAAPQPESNKPSGATYVRWGRNSCNKQSKLIYKGYAAGSEHRETGGGSNYLCLHDQPSWSRYSGTGVGWVGHVWGAEYNFRSEQSSLLSTTNSRGDSHHGKSVPCAVCQSKGNTALMIPGSTECESGWVHEYTGMVMSMYNRHKTRTEFVCMDVDPEIRPGTDVDVALFYFVQVKCGSLPCPPYVENRELACVVCTN